MIERFYFSLFIIMFALHLSTYTYIHTHTHSSSHTIRCAIHFNYNCFLILFLALNRNKLSFQWLRNGCSQLTTLNQMPLSINSFSHWTVSAPCALLLTYYVHEFYSDIRFIENWNGLLLLWRCRRSRVILYYFSFGTAFNRIGKNYIAQ